VWCTNCRTEHDGSAGGCPNCGAPAQKTKTDDPGPAASGGSDPLGTVDHTEIARRAKFDYSYGKRDASVKHLEVVQKLVDKGCRGHRDNRELLQTAADMIYKEFRLKDVTLGLWNPREGIYRYEVMAGMQMSAWTALKRISYTPEQFHDSVKYKGTLLGEQTRLFLAEDEPYAEGEEDTYDRSEYLKSKRRTLDQSIEGDYLDTYIFAPGREIIGWIEYAGTWGGRLPDTATIRWVELVATFLGTVIASHYTAKDMPARRL